MERRYKQFNEEKQGLTEYFQAEGVKVIDVKIDEPVPEYIFKVNTTQQNVSMANDSSRSRIQEDE